MRIGLVVALAGLAALVTDQALAQVSVGAVDQGRGTYEDKFRQFEGEDWPSPNLYRSATGAPGPAYWQQQVDYVIDVRLDEETHSLTARQRITYHNNSPEPLTYLWILLDQQHYARDSMSALTATAPATETYFAYQLPGLQRRQTWEGGFQNITVTQTNGRALNFTRVDALLRVDLPRPLQPGQRFSFDMSYSMPFAQTDMVGGRSGYECFPGPTPAGNCIFQAAQWFPRLAAFSDYEGWHTLPFLGSGEFPLEFGNYQVSITVPADHVVAASGELQNPNDVLTREQRDRMSTARRTTDAPIYVVTPDEALAREQGRETATRTWRFKADNVRDFAWASSRGFVWDAMAVRQDAPGAEYPVVMAMSFYTKEARPMWDTYSTRTVAHTIDVYGRFTFPYPYPTAQSVNGPVGGMEYPMITFNGARPMRDADGNIVNAEQTKFALIDVIIHEIGHIWFPMIVNNDERQWTWMDEGINTFLEYQAAKLWDPDFPASGEPRDIVRYMTSDNQVPLMTRSDTALNFGNNAYRKPGTALVILRETIMGRELFDRAFREYAERWKFKRPTPYDFFRTMEESSGMDLDWFWRGWFYSTDHVDISVENVWQARLEQPQPRQPQAPSGTPTRSDPPPVPLTVANNAGMETVIERLPAIDAYDDEAGDPPLSREQRRAIGQAARADNEAYFAEGDAFDGNIYRMTFKNVGGLVMPVILRLSFDDGTSEIVRIPAEIWRYNSQEVTWQYVTAKTLIATEVDPFWETADADRENNYFPRRATE